MNSTLGDMTQALQTLLMDHFRATTPAVDGQPFLAFEFGTPVPDETFHLPADNPDYSPAAALEYMSHHANVAPRVHEGMLFGTSNHIDALYGILLMGATAVDASGAELLGMVNRAARASFEDTLGTVRSSAIERFRPTHADPVNWYDQSASGNWTRLQLNQFDDPPPAPAPTASGGGGGGGGQALPRSPFLKMWRPAPEPLRAALAEPLSLKVVQKFEAQLRAPALTPVTPVTPLTRRAVPASLLARSASLGARPVASSRLNTAAFAALRQGLKLRDIPRVAAPPAPAAPLVESDQFSISVEVCLVHLRRPWLADGLLNLSGWFVPTVPKGSFSDGTGPGNPSPLAVLPVACVLIRNLAIKARWSDEDRALAETSTHLGTFSLLGRSFDQNTATLSVEGMQSIAWICQPMPVLPPQEPH